MATHTICTGLTKFRPCVLYIMYGVEILNVFLCQGENGNIVVLDIDGQNVIYMYFHPRVQTLRM